MSVRKRRQIPSTVPCPDGSDWYSCPGPLSFAGCCKSNACIRNQCPSGDFVAAITSSLSLSGSSNAPNPNSSGDFVADAYFPASPAGSPDSLNANLSEDIITDIPKSIPQPPDQALNEQPSSSSSSLGLPHSPTANVSSTKFTVPFPFSPEGTLGVPMPPLPTPSTITMTTPLEINSLSSRMTKIAATVGGIGGLVILVLLCVIFMLYRRQKTGEKPSRTHIHECQDMSRLEIDSRPYVSQLAGSPISELDSPSNAIHELPLPYYHSSILRKMPSVSTSDKRYAGNSLTESSFSHDAETPIERSLKL